MDMHEWLASGINIQQSGECFSQNLQMEAWKVF